MTDAQVRYGGGEGRQRRPVGGFPRWEGKAEQQCHVVSQLVKVF